MRRKEGAEDYFRTEHLLGNIQGRSLRGGVVTLAGQAAKFILNLVSTAVMARLLRPQDFGLLAMVTSIIAFAHFFKDLGLAGATVQRSQITHLQVSFLFWVNVGLSVAVALAVAALAPFIALFYHEPRLSWITLALSINFVFGGLVVQHQALLRRQMQFRELAVRDVIAMAFSVATGIVLAIFGFGYWSLVAVPIAANLANCVLVWKICHWRPSSFQRRVGARAMLAFGSNLTAANMLTYIRGNFDNILVGRVLGSLPLGIYSKAYGLLALPIGQISGPMSTVLLPGLSRLQQNASEYAKLFIRAVRIISLTTIPIVVFSFFLARDVVLVLLGRKWLPVAPVFQLLAPAALFGAIAFAPGWLCQSLGRAQRQLHYALVSSVLCVAGFLIGIRWGLLGIAVSYSINMSVLFWAFVWYASKDSPVKVGQIVSAFLSAFVPAIIAATAVWLLRSLLAPAIPAAIALLVLAILFSLVFLLSAILVPSNRELIFGAVMFARRKFRRKSIVS